MTFSRTERILPLGTIPVTKLEPVILPGGERLTIDFDLPQGSRFIHELAHELKIMLKGKNDPDPDTTIATLANKLILEPLIWTLGKPLGALSRKGKDENDLNNWYLYPETVQIIRETPYSKIEDTSVFFEYEWMLMQEAVERSEKIVIELKTS